MAKQYTKNTWVDEELADAERYNIIDNDELPINENVKIELATEVLQAGTQLNASRMNNIENGIDALDTILSELGGGLYFRGEWDASTEAYPAEPEGGDYYLITVAGTIEAVEYEVGDLIIWDGESWLKTTLSKEIDFSGALSYKGVWDASMEVYPSNPVTGDYYLINVAGTIDSISYAVGDIILYNGDEWEKTELGVDVVQNLSDLGDVDTAGVQEGEVLTYRDGGWTNESLPEPPSPVVEALVSASGVATVNFEADYLTHELTENTEYQSDNLSPGASVVIKLVGDTVTRDLTFPAGWIFLGEKPTEIEADIVAVLSLTSFGTADADVIAAYASEAE